MTRTSSRRASLLAIPVLALSALALSACSPITTDKAYSPSDGVLIDVNDSVRGLNLLVVSNGDGAPGTLLGGLSNEGPDDIEVSIAPEGTSAIDVPVDAGTAVSFGVSDGFEVQFGNIDVAAGATIPVTLTASDGSSASAFLPVLDGAIDEYAEYLPSGS